MRDDRARLRDILQALDRIQSEAAQGRQAFEADPKFQVWVRYLLQIVGEACRGLSGEFRAQFPDDVWSKAIGLRNILIHHYFEIDQELVWQVVQMDLPAFRLAVESALRRFS